MYPFRYMAVDSIDAAVSAMAANPEAAFIGGGTALIDLMKEGVQTPEMLIDINRLPLSDIEIKDHGVRIGSLVRNSDLARHPAIRDRYPFLSQALLSGASPQLRNMATVSGNLMQRTRCSYFRDTSLPCNKRTPGSGCGALGGQNRLHAILGTSEYCIATHPSDLAVTLSALDAVIHTRGPTGDRQIPIDSFFLLPGDTPYRETSLESNELITAVEIPVLPLARHSLFRKIRDRASYAFALVSVAVALELYGGMIRDVRIALGGVAHKPWRCFDAETELKGELATQVTFTRAAEIALRQAIPRTHNGFKVEMAKRLIVRALTELSERI